MIKLNQIKDWSGFMFKVKRLFVEKKEGFSVASDHLLKDIKENLLIKDIEKVRIINRYDVEGVTEEEYVTARNNIFSEGNTDNVYDETFPLNEKERYFGVEYLPGQYDQRSDSAEQCVQILTQKEKPTIKSAKIYVFAGNISEENFAKIKNYLINPVDSREASQDKPDTLEQKYETPEDVEIINNFISMSEGELKNFADKQGFAMSFEDLLFSREYFRDTEKRNPTITELKLIDTYWSDHCRHTTFLTRIEKIEFEESDYSSAIEKAYDLYIKGRDYVYGDAAKDRDISLMDLAVISMKELRKKGKLDDLDVSEEINACSINVKVDVDGSEEDYLIMFKNETHNHPTEIEPFGGAATCLGGAIRDPLSGRSYVYQAMRVTGAADPRISVENTIPGKLPQRKITREAAHGYSSYGNQIGLATGQVAEVYDEDFVAKRMEVGAVIAAVPKENVVRERPAKDDVIILVGGRTGRDGCGGATGSSKEHDEESIFSCGAEVQKGNPPTERKIQRLFRNPEVSKMIKRCNDFGAGGVSVAIGELTESLEVNLDAVPKKYEGLDGTELAISESQERMAVVISPENVERFIELSSEENVEATVVAKVTDSGRLIMKWQGKEIVSLSREFLDTNGVKQNTEIKVTSSSKDENYFIKAPEFLEDKSSLEEKWLENLKDLNVASQKGMTEMFDSTIGAGSVLMPLGGIQQLTPAEGMVCKVPLVEGNTSTATVMTYGYNPKIGKWSPFHGAMYAVLESIAKVAAIGGDYKKVRLSLQEYFEKLGDSPEKWGKPFSALLGANYIMNQLEIPAIGGKDSMSGTFKEINVPPTVVSFAVTAVQADKVLSPEFKKSGSEVVLLQLDKDNQEIPDFDQLKDNYSRLFNLIQEGKILSAQSVRHGGIAAGISKMSFGNKIGFEFAGEFSEDNLFHPYYGSIILELNPEEKPELLLEGLKFITLGRTIPEYEIIINEVNIDLSLAQKFWEEPLEKTFPVREEVSGIMKEVPVISSPKKSSKIKIASPKVFIPVFPGTNCEYDTAKAFNEAGGKAELMVFKNLKPSDIEESINKIVDYINQAQIIALPGGFSAGDEPDGSGKFIATVFRNPRVKEAVMDLLKNRDGLMLGICNGFQALIKLGLVPYGEIRDIEEDAPTLTFNKIGRHISCFARTKIVSNSSPWLANYQPGDISTVALSHGEGRFYANEKELDNLIKNGQIGAQYVDLNNNPTYDIAYNPNGSVMAIECITSPDGRVLGKMGHTERMRENVGINVPGKKDMELFSAGISYFS
jgi:phosphoribosylformylglycinamidine synthase